MSSTSTSGQWCGEIQVPTHRSDSRTYNNHNNNNNDNNEQRRPPCPTLSFACSHLCHPAGCTARLVVLAHGVSVLLPQRQHGAKVVTRPGVRRASSAGAFLVLATLLGAERTHPVDAASVTRLPPSPSPLLTRGWICRCTPTTYQCRTARPPAMNHNTLSGIKREQTIDLQIHL